MNQSAIDALAKAMVEMDCNFAEHATAYALISIASSLLKDEDGENEGEVWRQYEELMAKRRRVV